MANKPQRKDAEPDKAKKNSNLHAARREKNDEFYTQLSDIEKEMRHYARHFKGKVVFCNCDDPQSSNFWKYFELNFKTLGLRKLISTHYKKGGRSYKLECGLGEGGELITTQTTLRGDGDFRSSEAVAILAEADIVATNPPFSLFREFVAQLVEHGKKFLVIGSQNAITYKDIFALVQSSQLWLGCNHVKEFITPSGEKRTFGNILWFTNLEHRRRSEDVFLYKTYSKKAYPTYDNYDAIEVAKVADIPCDYEGAMGVPITFLEKFNPTQFEIIWTTDRGGDGYLDGIKKTHERHDAPVVRGRGIYKRIVIKNKTPQAKGGHA